MARPQQVLVSRTVTDAPFSADGWNRLLAQLPAHNCRSSGHAARPACGGPCGRQGSAGFASRGRSQWDHDDMERRWRLRATRIVFENSRVRVFEDDIVQPDGTPDSYTVVEERCGAVSIVAVDAQGRVALVRQHRYPIDAITLEVPAGEVSEGADPIEQARRELAEETGILADRLDDIGTFVPWPARVRRQCRVVLARELDLSKLAIGAQEGNESIHDVGLYAPTTIQTAIATGELFDGPTLCSLSLYWASSAPSD
jgi:ADP-ribose pyrophosphatase